MTQELTPAVIATPTTPPNYEVAAEVFARTGSVSRAAKKSGATPELVEQWLEEPRFNRLVRSEQKHLESATLFEIFKNAPSAIRFLEYAMRSNRKSKNLGTRVTAAKTLVEFWFRAQEFFALRRELDEIKKQLTKQGVNIVIDSGLNDESDDDTEEDKN